MTPVDQSLAHDPANGVWGDCMRACIASLLDLPIERVPHFFDGGCNGAVFDKRVSDFLGDRGLIEFSIPASAASRAHYSREFHHLMYGYTERGTYHAVVARCGLVVHDPHPSRAGIIQDDRVVHAFLVHASPTDKAKEP
jgi:hypothetical protein